VSQSDQLHRYHRPPPIIARSVALLLLLILALAIAACGETDDDGDNDAAPSQTSTPTPTLPTSAATPTLTLPTATSTEETEGEPTMPETDEVPPVVQAAIRTAAEDEGVEVSSVELLEFGQVEWSDSSLGCPQPGQFYAQVIVPGYLVRVSVDGNEIEYHTDMNRQIVRC
jgi:hypothetical protein